MVPPFSPVQASNGYFLLGRRRRWNGYSDCFEPLSSRGTHRVSLRVRWLNHSLVFQSLRNPNSQPPRQVPITCSRIRQAPHLWSQGCNSSMRPMRTASQDQQRLNGIGYLWASKAVVTVLSLRHRADFAVAGRNLSRLRQTSRRCGRVELQ